MEELKGVQIPNGRWGLLVVLFVSPIIILFAMVDDYRQGMTAAICVGIVIVIMKTFWVMKNYGWFWITVVIFLIMHMPIIVYFPIPASQHFSVLVLMPLALMDFVVLYKIMDRVARHKLKNEIAQ